MSALPEPFDAATYFDAGVAARYDQGIRLSCPGYDALHAMVASLLRLLPDDARVLSAGAGTGAEILALGRRFPAWRFTAVDVSPDMLRACAVRVQAAGMAGRVEAFAGRVEDYPREERFDAATSIFVAHFISGAERKLGYLRSIAGRLKPGAPLVLADLHGAKGSPEFIELLKAWLLHYVSHGANAQKLEQDLQLILRDIAFAPEAEILDLLEEAGFERGVRFYQSFLFGGWIAARRA